MLHVDQTRAPECEGHVTALSNEVFAGTRILGSSCHLLEILAEYCEMLDTLRQVYDLFLIGDMFVDHADMLQKLSQHRHMLDANLLHLCKKLKLYLAQITPLLGGRW